MRRFVHLLSISVVIVVVAVVAANDDNEEDNDGDEQQADQESSPNVLSPHVLQSYLSKLELDPRDRLLALQRINEQIGHIYKLTDDHNNRNDQQPTVTIATANIGVRTRRPSLGADGFGSRSFWSSRSNSRHRMPSFNNKHYQSKIVMHLEKLTSRSVLIRWNAVQLAGASSSRVLYKLEYWSKSEPDRVFTHDRLNATELQLGQLAPSTDYIVQLVGISVAGGGGGGQSTTEMSVQHFRTLANDLDAPQNVKAARFEPDKISIKWERGASNVGVATYRIYFREINPDEELDGSGGVSYDLEESEDWKLIDQSADRATETILEDLAIDRGYAIKLAAVDAANNEGPFSAVQILYHSKANGGAASPARDLNNGGEQAYSPSNNNDRQQQTMNINERVGMPQDVEVVEFAKSAKFSWLPPAPNQVGPYPIRSFLISFVDRPKVYRDTNGSLVTFHKGITTSIRVPAKEDGVSRLTWMVSGMEPFTEYDFNVSSTAYSPQLRDDVHSPPVRGRLKTRPARPTRVDPPRISEVYADNTVLVKLGNASALHGPITKYWLVIVPIDPLHRAAHSSGGTSASSSSSGAQHHQQPNMQAELADLQALLKYSLQNTSTSNGSAYITAEFAAEYWPREFIVGIGESVRYGRFVNRKLSSTVDYKAFTVAFAQEPTNETAKPANMILLADVLPGRTPLAGVASSAVVSSSSPLLLESDLFTFSSYSETFNTRMYDSYPDRHASSTSGGIELYNIFWVIGAVVAFIAIVAMVIFLSINFMQKRSKLNQAGAVGQNGHHHLHHQQQQRLLMNGNGHATLLRQQGNGVVVNTSSGGNMSATSSTSTTANLMGGSGNGSGNRTLETHLTKNGNIQTTLLRSAVQNNSSQKSSSSQMFELTQTTNGLPGTTAQPIISSSSSSSSTTASPTTALLSCSVNNTHHHHHNSGSQSSSNTNTTNTNNTQVGGMLAAVNGLLTTASPLKTNTIGSNGFQTSHHHSMPIQESLYTSIEVTQKLLQQQQHLAANNSLGNQYDNHLMMLMNTTATSLTNTTNINNNNNNSSTFSGLGTLSRSANAARALSQQQFSLPPHYDPIEYRRIHYPTQALAAHPPIHIDELFQQLERLKAQSNKFFSKEYESIEPGQQFTWETAISDVNRQKNRYANVVAFDHSRVILSRLDDDPLSMLGMSNSSGAQTSTSISTDYINANFCDGHRKSSAYIATQGPLPSTYGDFWRMVWEQGSSTIVMMTKLEERQRLKCDQYWPSKGTEVFDNCMQVTLVEHTELAAYSIRTFVISPVNAYGQAQTSANKQNVNFELRREVKHFQFTAWPDHGVPDHPTQFLMFVRRVRQSNPVDAGPVVVHCSAGVGRTGCYIVIDTMLERIRSGEKTIDIYGHVTCLRAQRNFMVQTEEQYIFCYDAVLEASQSGPTDVPAPMLYAHLQRLLQPASSVATSLLSEFGGGGESATPLTEMEIEYKRLSNIKAPQSKFHAANLPANKFKNRLVNILPYEATRVVLQCLPNQPETAGSDYINANFIDGYKYRRAYIATQAPLQETIDDFWRMLWEHSSTIVVMLTKLREMGREKCAQYWPVERSIRYQYFVVDPVAEYNMSSYILREFKMTDARDGQSRTIRQFQFVDWPEQGVPKSGETMIDLIGQVHRTKEQFGQTGPITVHCSAGVGRTGVFITLSIALERMRYEDHVDIYNTVKLLRTQRPAMVQTEDQYQFCYRAILEYLGSFD